jgi:Protein of unknown function (DUF998)
MTISLPQRQQKETATVTTRRLALAGLVGPPLFAALTILVTAVEWDLLHDLGWSAAPFDQPDTPWPSSAALGDYGFLQVLAFLLLGVSVLALAAALILLEVRRKIGTSLLVLLGAGLAASAIRTDYETATGAGPDTWNGVAHAAALTVVFPAALAAMVALGVQFRRDARWRRLSTPSLVGALVALASLVATLAGAGSLFLYVFLAIVLWWLVLVAAQALELAGSAR